jgi:hypothetical protein
MRLDVIVMWMSSRKAIMMISNRKSSFKLKVARGLLAAIVILRKQFQRGVN